MCDKANRAEKAELQAAAREDATTATPQVAAAATATKQVAAATTATPQVTAQPAAHKDTDSKKAQVVDPEFARAENEDDDGYDPYSDRRPVSEPLFERDPWS